MRTPVITRRAAAALLVVLGLAACDDTSTIAAPNDDVASSIQTDPQIMGVMHTSNLGEIAAGQVALQKASNAQVKSFAQMMITDHTTLDQQGTALAAQLGISPALPDQQLPTLQSIEMQTLNSTAAGATFDRVYIAQQITDHQRTLAIVDASLARASRAEIRTMLQQARPTIASHLTLAQSIQATVGQP